MHQAEDAAHDRNADEKQNVAVAGGVAIRKQTERPCQERETQRSAQQDRRLQGLGGGFRLDGAVTAPQPDQTPDRARPDKCAGKHNCQNGRRMAQMRECQRNRVHTQDEIEQRDLARKRRELRVHQFVIIGINPKQLQNIVHEATNEDPNSLIVPQIP
jgi:hypothetical protein